jgi:uncharacterized membrane protein
MAKASSRLYYIDALRAWAILMMLQGHFVDGLLDPAFRDSANPVYGTWSYFRGITAPVFFTVSGFIFTFLLLKAPEQGIANPRIQKGLKRGLQLLVIGYLLRLNLGGLLSGVVYPTFFMVDVLHCIGLSLISIVGMYLLAGQKKPWVFPVLLTLIGVGLFLFEPQYKQWTFTGWPVGLANYFTKMNGSVFTVFPWFGYAAFGGALSYIFKKGQQWERFYPVAISTSLLVGGLLIYRSSAWFVDLYQWSGWSLFQAVEQNNYLFIRLGNVCIALAVFMAVRKWFTHPTVIKIGQVTLSIYVIHYIFLYGSFTGLGFYRFWHHELPPAIVIPGALLFMILCTSLALLYNKHEALIHESRLVLWDRISLRTEMAWSEVKPVLRRTYQRLRWRILRFLFAKKQS